jgi:ParB family chromosome partitioning protein
VEELARRDGKKQARQVRRTGRLGPDPNTQALEKRLTDAIGLSVRILHRADGEGVISVRYRNLEQLDDIARRLETGPVTGTTAPDSTSGGPRIRTL